MKHLLIILALCSGLYAESNPLRGKISTSYELLDLKKLPWVPLPPGLTDELRIKVYDLSPASIYAVAIRYVDHDGVEVTDTRVAFTVSPIQYEGRYLVLMIRIPLLTAAGVRVVSISVTSFLLSGSSEYVEAP